MTVKRVAVLETDDGTAIGVPGNPLSETLRTPAGAEIGTLGNPLGVTLRTPAGVQYGVPGEPVYITGCVGWTPESPVFITGTDRISTTLYENVSTSGDNIVVAAPGAGHNILVTSFTIQNESAVATQMIIHSGSTTNGWRWLCQAQGSGLSKDFPCNDPWRLGNNENLNVTLFGANLCSVSVKYFTEPVR